MEDPENRYMNPGKNSRLEGLRLMSYKSNASIDSNENPYQHQQSSPFNNKTLNKVKSKDTVREKKPFFFEQSRIQQGN